MKIRFNKGAYHVPPRAKIGLLVFMDSSRFKDFWKVICFTLTLWNTQYGFSIHFGHRFYPRKGQWKVGDQVVCVNSEETCQLREGRVYEIERLDYRPSHYHPDWMELRLHLKGFDGLSSHVNYEVGRFRKAVPTDFPEGPVS